MTNFSEDVGNGASKATTIDEVASPLRSEPPQVEAAEPSRQDALLECLVSLTQIMDNPYSADSLIAGLPLENHQLTPRLFERAAQRAGLSARLLKQSLENISKNHLPAVLLLKDNKACVLVGAANDGVLEIIQPGMGTGVTNMPVAELEAQYTGSAFGVKKKYRFDTRAEEPEKLSQRHWFWSVIKKISPLYSEVLVASFLINIFAITVPLFIMNVYDRVVPNEAFTTLGVLAVGMCIVVGFDFMMRALRSYFIDVVGRRIDIQMSAATFEQLMNVKMSHRPSSVGSLANTVQSFDHFKEFISSTTVTVLVDLPFVLLFLFVIWIIHPVLTLVSLLLIPTVVLFALISQKLIGDLVNKVYRHASEKQAILIESLVGAETIKTLGAEGLKQAAWESVVQQSAKLNIKLKMLINMSQHFGTATQYLSTVAIVTLGVYLIVNNELTVGGLIASTILTSRIMVTVVQMSGLLVRYKQSRLSLSALDGIMNLPCDRQAEKSYLHYDLDQGDIEFKKVSFGYSASPVKSIDNVSFKIKSGEHVGIVGPVGSGKSTLLKLILNLYQPTEGQICIDGIESSQIDPAQLRRHIGYIPQQIVLFHGSIRDNIAMSGVHVDDAAILRASKIAGITDFVNRHPDGFDREVGERGHLLSGGQQQAIGVARALLFDPPIYLFDEPTSSMDSTRVHRLIADLKTEMPGKTLVLVSHKASTLSLVDRIIVMDNGKMVADGPKDEVLKRFAGRSQ